jgi:hypothetical protein
MFHSKHTKAKNVKTHTFFGDLSLKIFSSVSSRVSARRCEQERRKKPEE